MRGIPFGFVEWRNLRMKYAFTAAIVALTVAGSALAQTPAAPPAPPPPPSACPAYPTAPTLPAAGEVTTVRALDSNTAKVNAYLNEFQTVHSCRIDEVNRLKAQSDARVTEARAAQDAALAYRASWQSVTEAFAARGKRKDPRSVQ